MNADLVRDIDRVIETRGDCVARSHLPGVLLFGALESSRNPIVPGQEDIRLSRPAQNTTSTGGSRLRPVRPASTAEFCRRVDMVHPPPLLLRSRMRWQSLPVLIDVSESSPQPDTTAESSRNRDDTCGDCCRSGWCDVIAAVNAPLTAVASALGAAGSPVTSPELRDLPLPFVGKQHPGTVPAKRAVHETVRVQGVSHTDFDGGSGPGWPPSYLVARVVISAVVRAWS